MERLTRSPDETEHFGRELASRLQPGDVVLLEGGLGAGKTVVVRGIVRGLDSTDHVSSPTFVLVHEYRGRYPVAHADLYRLSGPADLEDLGLDEYLDGRFVVLVEWPERAEGTDWGRRTWRVRLECASAEERIIRVQAPPGEGDA
ncbi:MAG: tRNA (adenosine(37)-N6)-threonylcarbamoyltransferase complex ATPase subunit type 1 TsaE [Armatimonadota bacterium]